MKKIIFCWLKDKGIVLIRLSHKYFEKAILSPVEPITSKMVKTIWHTSFHLIVVNGTNFDQVINFEILKRFNCSEINHASFFEFSEHFELMISHIIFDLKWCKTITYWKKINSSLEIWVSQMHFLNQVFFLSFTS